MLEKKMYTPEDVNAIIQNIALGVSSSSGDEFFEKLVHHLWKLYRMKYIFVGLLDEKEETVGTLKFCIDGETTANFSYPLEGTPCKSAIGRENCVYQNNVKEAFPQDVFVQEHNIQSYIGIRLFDSLKKGIGLIACLDSAEIDSTLMMRPTMEIFASRASAEIKRMQAERDLEKRVLERTKELEEALEQIKEQSHKQLLETEKMASLGAMVAGFTHDLNTPIGLSITGVSYIQSENKRLAKEIEKGTLSKNSLQDYLENGTKMIDTMAKGLDHAKELVRSFKLISIDQHLDDEKSIYLRNYLDDILLSLHFKLKHTNISILNKIPISLEIKAHAGMFFQIFENLIMNSIVHAFDEQEEGRIEIDANYDNGLLNINYKDNGKGMDKEIMEQMFDQFYTTKKERGSSGLGMYIVYDLVVNQSGGNIEVNSERGKGSEFTIKMKI